MPRTAEAPDAIMQDPAEVRRLLADHIVASARGTGPVRVLEAGCGQCWPLPVGGAALHITGIDSDPAAMAIRREHHGDLDVAVVGDLATVDLEPAAFDVVYCGFVLEHVHGAEAVLDRLVAAVRPGGRIIVRVPDGDTAYGFVVRHTPHRLHVLYKRYVEGSPDAGKAGHAPYPVVYDEVISMRGMRNYAERSGLEILATYGTNTAQDFFGRLAPLAQRALRLVARLSGRRMLATHNNISIIMRRPLAR